MSGVVPLLCNKTFADANVTGFNYFEVPTNVAYNASWALTLSENNSTIESALWYNTGGVNYSRPSSIGYDVCQLPLPSLTDLAVERASASDDGSCNAALSDDCVNDLSAYVIEATNKALANLDPSHTSTNALNDVCYDASRDIVQNLPASCSLYLDNTIDLNPVALTGYGGNVSYLYSSSTACVVAQDANAIRNLSASSNVWWIVGGENGAASLNNYTILAQSVIPILTTFLPYLGMGSLNGGVAIQSVVPYLSCLRTTNFSSSSLYIPPLTVPQSNRLSGGDIAGIVIGSVAGVAILAAILAWLLRRRRQRQREMDRRREEDEQRTKPAELAGQEPTSAAAMIAAEKNATEIADGDRRLEAVGSHEYAHELDHDHRLNEMESPIAFELDATPFKRGGEDQQAKGELASENTGGREAANNPPETPPAYHV